MIAFDHQYAIIKLSKSYFQKINIAKFEKKKIFKSDPDEPSIINLANIIGGFAIIFDDKINFYKKNEKSDKYNKYELIDSLDTEGGGDKNIIQIKDNQIEFYQSLDKILAIFNLSKKIKLLTMSIVNTEMKKISNNILALVNLDCIKLLILIQE